MDDYIKQIKILEQNSRVALTSKYPLILPLVLETKRALRSMSYKLHPRFKMVKLKIDKLNAGEIAIDEIEVHKYKEIKWSQITEHSSPLYRKYNKKELDDGKVENIKIAIKSLDGIIIPPQKTFSFWKHVGRSSSKRGFKKGLVLSAGKLKEDVGGGLCQLSNLIAYMFACSEITFIERKHHSKDVFPDYNRVVPFASGATVFFNLIDLKVKNTYPFPVKINLRTTDTQLRGSLSIPASLDYFVKLEENDSCFIKSNKTGKLYRCNKLNRVFYKKITKEKITEEELWLNVAEVMYDEKSLNKEITSVEI